MKDIAKIIRDVEGHWVGDGFPVRTLFSYHSQDFDVSPFLLLDHAGPAEFTPADKPRGVGQHPHRGFETVTIVYAGEVEHRDNAGNSGRIGPGDVQWMTAGSGIIHQEMPKGREDGLLWGFQLWANLPSLHKMMEPRYRDVKHLQIPEVRLNNNVMVKIICGKVNRVNGPVKDIITDPEYLDVRVPPDTNFIHRVKEGYNVFAYVIEGKGYFESERNPYGYEIEGKNYFDFKRECLIGAESLVIFEDGEKLSISTEDEGVRFLLISGKPIRESVAWYGPIVMNTQEELSIAFEEYQSGTFLKHGSITP